MRRNPRNRRSVEIKIFEEERSIDERKVAPKKAPIPFEHIAIAVAFSPSLNDIISEAIKIASIFNSKLYFIHIGSAEEKLSELGHLDPLKWVGHFAHMQ